MLMKQKQPIWSSFPKNTMLPLFVSLVGLIILFKDLLFSPNKKVLWISDFDTKLIYWIVSWGYHALAEKGNFGGFWNANAFYPFKNTLAYSDSLLSIQLFIIPLRKIGFSMLDSLYLALALTILFSCIMTIIALKRIGNFSSLEMSFIVFGSHFCLSIVMYLGHYQLVGFEIVPPYLLFLYLFLRDFRFSDFCSLCLLAVFGICFATYLGPILVLLTITTAIPLLIRAFWRRDCIKLFIEHNFWKVALIGLFVIGFLYVAQIRPYLAVREEYGKPRLRDMIVYSASPISIFTEKSMLSYWYKNQVSYNDGDWESTYFPGYLLLSIGGMTAIIATAKLLWAATQKQWKKLTHEAGWLTLYAVVILFLVILFSLGAFLKTSPDQQMKLPYYYFIKVIPGLDSVRAPGRIGMFVGFPLSLLTVLGIQAIQSRFRLAGFALPVCLVLLMIESLPSFSVYPFDPDATGVHQVVSTHIQEDTPLLELPICSISTGQIQSPLFAANHMRMISNLMNQLVGSTHHWAKLPVGYGAKQTPQFSELLALDCLAQEYPENTPGLLNFAEEYKIPAILVHREGITPISFETWLSYCKLWENDANADTVKDFLLNTKDQSCTSLQE